MPTLTIEEAQNKLSELIHRLAPGEEVVVLPITLDHAERLATLPLHHRDPFDRLLDPRSCTHT
jgi:PIN domain nuclease of toxin-antitoxin system